MSESSQRLRELDSFKRKLRMSPGGVLYDPLKFSLPDGDLAVLDDLMSFREYNNLMANFPGAGAISNPQAGAIQYYSGTKLWKGYDGVAWKGLGRIAQVITDTYTTVATLGTGFPNDDTKPQIDEGDEIMDCIITPQDASSTIAVFFFTHLRASTDFALSCLFRSILTNDALQLTLQLSAESGLLGLYLESAATTNVRTYPVRVGDSTGNNVFTNNAFGGTKFGAVEGCYMAVMEILP